MVFNFICRASKANKEGLSPVELSLLIDGERRYVTLDLKVKASTFDAKTQKFKKNQGANELPRCNPYKIVQARRRDDKARNHHQYGHLS